MSVYICLTYTSLINTLSTRDANTEFANSVDLVEAAQYEPHHQDLHCLAYVCQFSI